MTNSEISILRANYTLNVNWVVQTILDNNIKLAMGGPEVLGEASVGIPSRFFNKSCMLDDYRLINKNISAVLKIPYLDIRQAFLDAKPTNWMLYRGWVTQDGEHPNIRGTVIEAGIFASQIQAWYNLPIPNNAKAAAAYLHYSSYSSYSTLKS